MININEKSKKSSDFNDFLNLYEQSFPADERRTRVEAEQIARSDPRFHLLEAWEGYNFLGFFSYWDLGDFAYGEHFAVCESLRGHGKGSEILNRVVAGLGMPLLIEVEPPTTEIARRRIGFYERHGLRLWPEVSYLQPPYSAGKSPVPLLLMTAGFTSPEAVSQAARVVRREAYRAPE